MHKNKSDDHILSVGLKFRKWFGLLTIFFCSTLFLSCICQWSFVVSSAKCKRRHPQMDHSICNLNAHMFCDFSYIFFFFPMIGSDCKHRSYSNVCDSKKKPARLCSVRFGNTNKKIIFESNWKHLNYMSKCTNLHTFFFVWLPKTLRTAFIRWRWEHINQIECNIAISSESNFKKKKKIKKNKVPRLQRKGVCLRHVKARSGIIIITSDFFSRAEHHTQGT